MKNKIAILRSNPRLWKHFEKQKCLTNSNRAECSKNARKLWTSRTDMGIIMLSTQPLMKLNFLQKTSIRPLSLMVSNFKRLTNMYVLELVKVSNHTSETSTRAQSRFAHKGSKHAAKGRNSSLPTEEGKSPVLKIPVSRLYQPSKALNSNTFSTKFQTPIRSSTMKEQRPMTARQTPKQRDSSKRRLFSAERSFQYRHVRQASAPSNCSTPRKKSDRIC